jgi:indoleamine 2,3-dioxygenase
MRNLITRPKKLPASISIPFLAVSDLLGLPPVATASALNSWNFSSADPNSIKLDNLSSCHTLTGTRCEEWFYLVTVAIEARGAEIIREILKAMDAVRANDPETVSQCLLKFADGIQEIGFILERTNEECDPDVFYHQIRPLLAGSKNMSAAGLPNGVFYDEGDGKGQWRQYSGGSNAQSSLIQFLDIVLGVEHFHTKPSNGGAATPKEKGGFLLVHILPN